MSQAYLNVVNSSTFLLKEIFTDLSSKIYMNLLTAEFGIDFYRYPILIRSEIKSIPQE
mgnify:CR=1 FL=1